MHSVLEYVLGKGHVCAGYLVLDIFLMVGCSITVNAYRKAVRFPLNMRVSAYKGFILGVIMEPRM